jgi:hypothetical protein
MFVMRLLSRFFAAALVSAALLVASPAGAATSTPRLMYYGGRVVSHVKIDVVVWSSWSYGTTVPLTGHRSIASFAGGIANSPYLDWLREYNTPTQQIGRGTLDKVITVHPPAGVNTQIVTDAQIKMGLTQMISVGTLPKPSANRVYLVFFRRGQVVSRPEGDSRHGFCAYHDTLSYPSHSAYYAVVPYELDNAGCRVAPASFDRVTTVASHELVEAITDPGIGLRKLSWYDRAHGEIADICAHTSTPGAVVGGDGVRYVVQREWSNRRRGCVLTG